MTPPDSNNFAAGFAEVAGRSRERAERWRRTLQPVLERMNSPLLSRSELEQIAVNNSVLQFGRAKSARHIRRMMAEVMTRDGGRKDWGSVDLYLEKNPPRLVVSSKVISGMDAFAELRAQSSGFTNPSAPSAVEEAMLIRGAWDCHQQQLLNGVPAKRAKTELLEYLWRWMPWLSTTRRGLADKMARKFHHYEQSHGEAVSLLDGRARRAGESRADKFSPAHLDHVIWHAARNCGGRVAQAVEDLIVRGEEFGLPADLTEFLLRNRGAGSYVNRRLLNAVKPEVESIRPYLLGSKAVDDATAPLRRTYDKLRSMTVVTGDDLTAPVYGWLKDDAGNPVLDAKGKPVITRGQVLAFIDVRSLRIITWVLIPARNYNSTAIRTCMNMICREHGIPAVWLFENGLWKRSRLVKQIAPLHWRIAHSDKECEFGWEQLGSRFIHAKRARSKPIEKIFDLIQRLMEGELGYCGRDERRDCPEATKLAKLAVEAGREHPSKHFLSFDQWETRLGQIIDRYNADPQNGRHAGMSPDQVFEANWPHDDPPTPMNATCWHLGAHTARLFRVAANGITWRIGKQVFAYWDESLSPLRGREVIAWFNPETPEFISVTETNDPMGKHARFVSRNEDVDFLATINRDSMEAETYRRGVEQQQGFNSFPKARYHALKANFKQSFRTVIVDRNTAAMADALKRGSDEKMAVMKEEDSAVRRIQDKARRLGQAPTELRDYSPETEVSLDRRLKARREAGKEIEEES